jgi:hypothetical protein
MKKSDRQQTSDDWKELTSNKPVIIFDKKYEGFESLYDLDRDICEAVDPDFNPLAKMLAGEYEGTVQVIMVYTPKGKR